MNPHYTNTCFECGQAMPADAWEAERFTDDELKVIAGEMSAYEDEYGPWDKINSKSALDKAKSILLARACTVEN